MYRAWKNASKIGRVSFNQINIRHYQKVEEGTVNVTLRTVELLAEAFGVDVADMFRR
jgi:hypothetical protein